MDRERKLVYGEGDDRVEVTIDSEPSTTFRDSFDDAIRALRRRLLWLDETNQFVIAALLAVGIGATLLGIVGDLLDWFDGFPFFLNVLSSLAAFGFGLPAALLVFEAISDQQQVRRRSLGAAHQTIRRGGYVALAQAELLVAATFDEQEAFVLHQKELAAVTPRADPREVARLVPAGSAHLAWLDTWFDREVIPGASGIHIYDAAISIVRQAIDSQERQAPASRLVNRRRRAGLSRAADGVGDLLRRAAFARAMVPYDPALGAQVIAAWNTFKDLGVPSVLPRFPDRLIWGPALPTQRRSFSFDTPEARWWTVVGTFLEDGGRWLDNSQVVIDRTPEQRAKESLAAVQDVLLRPDGARQALEGLFKLLVAFRFLDWVDRELGAIAPTEAGLALPRFSHRTAPGYRETTTSY